MFVSWAGSAWISRSKSSIVLMVEVICTDVTRSRWTGRPKMHGIRGNLTRNGGARMIKNKTASPRVNIGAGRRNVHLGAEAFELEGGRGYSASSLQRDTCISTMDSTVGKW